MSRARVLPSIVLLLVLLVPAGVAAAQTFDPRILVVPPSDLGAGWYVSDSSFEGDQNAYMYRVAYQRPYSPPLYPALVTISLALTPNESAAAAQAEHWAGTVRSSIPDAALECLPVGDLGDGPAFTCTGEEGAGTLTVTYHIFRVGRMSVGTGFLGPEDERRNVTSAAGALARLQQDRLRELLPPETPPPPYCNRGQTPRFQFGFAALKAAIGAPMGEPVECEHTEVATGDAHQRTTTGLSFYRKNTNTPTFTNGFEHWALTPRGLVYWTGDSIDPPPEARPVGSQPARPPLLVDTSRELRPAWELLHTRRGR